jgi:hypothetical protein
VTANDLTARAADLAEALVDEISRPDQQWAEIARLAEELATLARSAPRSPGHGASDDAPPGAGVPFAGS